MEQISVSKNTAVDWVAFHREFMFIKRCRYQKLDVLTKFFKNAGQLYDLLLMNDNPNFEENNVSDESSFNTDDEYN